MSEIPGARVVRGGECGLGEGGGDAAARRRGEQTEPTGHVLRLAPRMLPDALVWRLLFGGPIALAGWIFVVAGLGILLVIAPMIDLSFGYDRRERAAVTRIEATSGSENEQRVYRVHYTFRDDAGVERTGSSYTTAPPAGPGAWDVEYRSDDPSASRLVEMRRGALPWFLLFVVVFPIIGLAIALWQLRAGRANLRLLRHGAEARGKLIRKRETKVSVNDDPVMALTFEYEALGRRHTATVKTLTPQRLEDDALEAMLYDPHAPWRATTLDHLPGAPRITASGELAAKAGFAGHLLLLPLLSAVLLVATVARVLA